MLEHAQRWQPQQAQFLRRCALFVAFLLSGGNPLIPREPLAALLLILCFLIGGARMGLRREMAGIGVLMLAVLAVAFIGAGDFLTKDVFVRMINFILALFLLGIYLELPKSTIVDDIVPILKLTAIQALVTVVLATFLPNLFSQILYVDTYYNHFAYILWYHDVSADSSFLKRPDNFFHEAGVLQIYMNIFLLIALFIRKNKNMVILSSIAVLATQSTIGIAIMSALIGIAYFENLKNVQFSTKLLVSVLAPIVAVPMLYVLSANVQEKFTGDLRGSSWAREYDLITGLNVALANPIVGIGFEYARYYRESVEHGYKGTQLDDSTTIGRSNTNGIVAVLYTVGFPIAFLIFIGLFRQKFFHNRILFSFVIFVSLLGQTLFYTPFFLMFVYSGLLLRAKAAPRRASVITGGRVLVPHARR